VESLAVIVPVKRFADAKQRMSPLLSPAERALLAQVLAAGVLQAAAGVETRVVCDDDDVAAWSQARGARVAWQPGVGLNDAVRRAIDDARHDGVAHVIVTHADLPHPDGLLDCAVNGTIALVPDRRRDGTNVMSFPTDVALFPSYGPGSFGRHRRQAQRRSAPLHVLTDTDLSWDVDVPTDLPTLRGWTFPASLA
jgi:2-phospho-L-lactate/phosphoenolpyruvate guanylyltransferase